ncbi:MAG: hypothetical protein KDJ80_06990 [Nitratireductor sp.]|nr:hypothetical protein [Nitratireductor sp.]
MTLRLKILTGLLGIGVAAGASAAACAAELSGDQMTLQGSQVRFNLGSDYHAASLSVSGPDGYYATASSTSGSVAIDLIRSGGTSAGTYNYQLSAATGGQSALKQPVNNGRSSADTTEGAGVVFSGSFYAANGLISDKASQSEE